MADAEGFQPLLLAQEGPVDLLEAQQGLRFHRLAAAHVRQPAGGQRVEPLMQRRHVLGPHSESPGGRVAAEALQQIGAAGQGLIHGKAARRPHGGPQPALPLAGQQGGGPPQAVHQPGGHDADHAVVPVALGQQQEGAALGAIGLQQGQGLGFDRLAEVAPLAVQGLAFAGQCQRLLAIGTGEQLHHQLGIAEPAHGIDARRQLEAHGLGIERLLLDPRQPLQGLQSWQGAVLQVGQAVEQPAPVHPQQRGHVGDGADAEQIARHHQLLGPSHGCAQSRRQHIGQAHPGQAPVGRLLGGDGRMQQGQVGRQLGRQAVVVGENHLQAQLPGPFQRLVGGHAVVDGDQQGHPGCCQLLHHRHIEPVAIALAAGNGGPGDGPESLQHSHQQGGAGHAVGVVVAADRHQLAAAAGPLQPLHRRGQIGEVLCCRWSGGGLQQGGHLLGAAQAPAGQYGQQRLRQGGQSLGVEGLQRALDRQPAQGRGQLPALLIGVGEQRRELNLVPLWGCRL